VAAEGIPGHQRAEKSGLIHLEKTGLEFCGMMVFKGSFPRCLIFLKSLLLLRKHWWEKLRQPDVLRGDAT
jgi:hypothetical protein